MEKTLHQYDAVVAKCRDIFEKKTVDYGTAWRVLRPSSITDQIFIKANRIRTLEMTGASKVDEGIEPEFVGIINYAIMGIIQLQKGIGKDADLSPGEALPLYLSIFNAAKTLMTNKNHDYGEAWRDMRVSSMTDLILMKILRTKQIEDNENVTLISEGIDANYFDMINYAVFALIKMSEQEVKKSK